MRFHDEMTLRTNEGQITDKLPVSRRLINGHKNQLSRTTDKSELAYHRQWSLIPKHKTKHQMPLRQQGNNFAGQVTASRKSCISLKLQWAYF